MRSPLGDQELKSLTAAQLREMLDLWLQDPVRTTMNKNTAVKQILESVITVDWTAVVRYLHEQGLEPNDAKEDRMDYYVARRVEEGVMLVPNASEATQTSSEAPAARANPETASSASRAAGGFRNERPSIIIALVGHDLGSQNKAEILTFAHDMELDFQDGKLAPHVLATEVVQKLRDGLAIPYGDIILSISQTGPGYCFITRFAAIDTDGEVMYVDGMQELPTQILGAEEAKGPVQEAHFVLHYNIELDGKAPSRDDGSDAESDTGTHQRSGRKRAGHPSGIVRSRGAKDEAIVAYLRGTDWHDHSHVLAMRAAIAKKRRSGRPVRTLCEWARTVTTIMKETPYDIQTKTHIAITRKAVGTFLGGWKGEWVTQAMKCGAFLQDANNHAITRKIERDYQDTPLGMGKLLEMLFAAQGQEIEAAMSEANDD